MADLICKLRKPKIMDMSIFDWVGSIVVAALVGHFVLRLHTPIAWGTWLTLWVLFGITVHWALGIDTMLGYYIGINPAPTRKDC